MIFRKCILSIVILLVLFITSSCNEDKKFVEKGKESLKDNKQEQALVYFDKALEINPKNKEALISKGKILLLKLETTGEADICFAKVLKIDTENTKAWNGKGWSFYIQKKDKEALECFDTALSKDPNNIDSLRGKILVFENQDNFEDIMTCYKKVLQLNQTEGNILKENILTFLCKL